MGACSVYMLWQRDDQSRVGLQSVSCKCRQMHSLALGSGSQVGPPPKRGIAELGLLLALSKSGQKNSKSGLTPSEQGQRKRVTTLTKCLSSSVEL